MKRLQELERGTVIGGVREWDILRRVKRRESGDERG